MRFLCLLALFMCAEGRAGEAGFPNTTGYAGFSVSPAADGLAIEAVLPGSAAARAGLNGGMVETVIAIEGTRLTAPIDLPATVTTIRGTIGTFVTLRIRRETDLTEREVRLQRQSLPIWASTKAAFEPKELDALARLELRLLPLLTAVQAARDAVVSVTLQAPPDRIEIARRVQDLGEAEAKLALAEATSLAELVQELGLSPTKRSALIHGLASYETRP